MSDVQFALADLVHLLASQQQTLFGTLRIDPALVSWAHGPPSNLADIGEEYRYVRNGDTMFHVNKGVFGLRMGGGQDICLHQVAISDVGNVGDPGQLSPLPGETGPVDYRGAENGGHPAQGLQVGYMGSDAYGMGLSAMRDVHVHQVNISQVDSSHGWAHGLAWINGASDGTFSQLQIKLVYSSDTVMGKYKSAQSTGLFLDPISDRSPAAAWIEKDIDISGIGSLSTRAYSTQVLDLGVTNASIACSQLDIDVYNLLT